MHFKFSKKKNAVSSIVLKEIVLYDFELKEWSIKKEVSGIFTNHYSRLADHYICIVEVLAT